jgi:hypothetical protein
MAGSARARTRSCGLHLIAGLLHQLVANFCAVAVGKLRVVELSFQALKRIPRLQSLFHTIDLSNRTISIAIDLRNNVDSKQFCRLKLRKPACVLVARVGHPQMKSGRLCQGFIGACLRRHRKQQCHRRGGGPLQGKASPGAVPPQQDPTLAPADDFLRKKCTVEFEQRPSPSFRCESTYLSGPNWSGPC